MKVSVRGHIIDLLAFKGLSKKRHKRIARSLADPIPPHATNTLAEQLHPDHLDLIITDARDETQDTRTFRLVPDPDSDTKALPWFRAGQYLSVKADVNGVRTTRPYSVSSAPFEALGDSGFYELTIEKAQDGFLTEYVWEHWQVGTRVRTSGPLGTVYYEPLRDAKTLVGLAGGSGITPFRSMAREIVFGSLDAELLVIYGSSSEDILFCDEFKDLESKSAGRVRIVHVLSCEIVSRKGCDQGFLTAEIIAKHADTASSSFFVCGPQVMIQFLAGELPKLNLPKRWVRLGLSGTYQDITSYPGFPSDAADRTFRLKVRIGDVSKEIPARATESIVVAMERAGLAPPSQCRAGACGYCRSRLVAGDVFVSPENDGRRAADKQFKFFHPCSSYPISDLEIVVPRNG